MSRLIAFGDVHGCDHALEAVLEAVVPAPDDHLVFVGDLIDQGRDSAAVLERLIQLRQRYHVTLIQGNHEEMLYAARDSEQALRYWEECGGIYTLNSYQFGAGLNVIPPRHWALLDSCVPYLETDDFIITHANYRPDVPMSEQDGHLLRWGCSNLPRCSRISRGRSPSWDTRNNAIPRSWTWVSPSASTRPAGGTAG